MKINSILKALVAVTAVGVAGTVIYSKVKENKEKEAEETKTTVDEVVVDDEPEPEVEKTIIEKFDIFTDSLTTKQKVICAVGFLAFGGFIGGVVGRQVRNDIIKDINNDPTINFMKETTTMTLKAIRMGVISCDELVSASELYDREVK